MKICILDGDQADNESEEEFVEFLGNDDLVHFLLFAFHPNTASFVNTLVKKLETSKNKEIWFRNIEWGDYFWYFVSIPKNKIDTATLVAARKRLRVLDGIQTIVIGNKKLLFPIKKRENICTLISKKPTEN